MTFQHLGDNPRQQARGWNIPLGVAGFRYADLNRVRRLEALDQAFLDLLRREDAGLAVALEAYRAKNDLAPLDESKLLMAAARHLGRFVARLFHVEAEYEALCSRVRGDEVIAAWKRGFVERRVLKDAPRPDELAALDPAT